MSDCLVEVEFDWWSARFTPEQQAHLKNACIGDVVFKEDGAFDGYGNVTMAIDLLAPLASLSPRIKRVIKNGSTAALASFGQRSTTVVNERVSVAVAGLGLLTVDEVVNHNDMCTEKLQEELAAGWRILAVCVQPDQRRPDYILGRTRKP